VGVGGGEGGVGGGGGGGGARGHRTETGRSGDVEETRTPSPVVDLQGTRRCTLQSGRVRTMLLKKRIRLIRCKTG
jgi:hypothetical protein